MDNSYIGCISKPNLRFINIEAVIWHGFPPVFIRINEQLAKNTVAQPRQLPKRRTVVSKTLRRKGQDERVRPFISHLTDRRFHAWYPELLALLPKTESNMMSIVRPGPMVVAPEPNMMSIVRPARVVFLP
jgi:hypothetical protein